MSINIKDFQIQETEKDLFLVNIAESLNAKLFLKKGFDLTDELSYSIDNLKENEINFLVESISQSNIEKAVFVMDHTNDELIKSIRDSRGDVKSIHFYNTLNSMIDDVTRANITNKEILTSKEILMELEKNKSIYTNAFRTDNTYRKAIYVSSVMAVAYTIIKEHLAHVDFTASKNEGHFVMKDDVPGEYIDRPNLINLKNNLKLIKTKVIADGAKDKTVLKEGFNDLAMGFANFVDTSFGAAKTAGDVLHKTVDFATSAASNLSTVAEVVAIASAAMYGLYLISKLASVNIRSYIDSYNYIEDNKKKATNNPSTVFKVFDKLFSFRKLLYRIWANKNSKNIQEYMKELNKDKAVIEKFADKKPHEKIHEEPTSSHNQRIDNSINHSFI